MTALSRAEEHGQSRKLEADEVLAFTLLSTVKASAVAVAADALVIGGRLVIGEDVSLASIALTTGGVFAVSLAAHVLGDLDTLTDGLRAWRSVETFAPPEAKPEPKSWRPPIPVIRRDDVRLLDMNDKPTLPQPEPEPLLTPQRVLEILRASVENDGSFSRRTITGVKLSDGTGVTRGMWREMSAWLHHVGVLRQDNRGSYCLPHQVKSLDDLFIQLPGLARLDGLDGQRTGLDTGSGQSVQSASGEVGSLAERRRQRFIELGCDVTAYLEERNNGS